MRDTIDMAREAGGFGYVHDAGDEPHKWQFTPTELKAFEALVRADEREACAKVCDDLHPDWKWRAAESIRARGNT
jgi:hypothetical protein